MLGLEPHSLPRATLTLRSSYDHANLPRNIFTRRKSKPRKTFIPLGSISVIIIIMIIITNNNDDNALIQCIVIVEKCIFVRDRRVRSESLGSPPRHRIFARLHGDGENYAHTYTRYLAPVSVWRRHRIKIMWRVGFYRVAHRVWSVYPQPLLSGTKKFPLPLHIICRTVQDKNAFPKREPKPRTISWTMEIFFFFLI